MTQEKKKYITKTISFGGSKMTLYSVDGNTWSSRLDELDLLQERFENGGRLPADATKGKQPFVIRKNKFAKRAAEDEPPSMDDYDDTAVAIEDETIAGVVLEEELEDDGLEDEVPTIKALSKAARKGAEVGSSARSKEDKSTSPLAKAATLNSPTDKGRGKGLPAKPATSKEEQASPKGATAKDKGKGKETAKLITKSSTKATEKTSTKAPKPTSKSATQPASKSPSVKGPDSKTLAKSKKPIKDEAKDRVKGKTVKVKAGKKR